MRSIPMPISKSVWRWDSTFPKNICLIMMMITSSMMSVFYLRTKKNKIKAPVKTGAFLYKRGFYR